MRAVATVDEHSLVVMLKENMVGGQPVSLNDGQAVGQSEGRRRHDNLLVLITKCKGRAYQGRMVENKGYPYDAQTISPRS